MAYSWMKLHCNLLDNPKTGFLPDTLWRKYIELNLIAKEFDRNGQLPNEESIAWRLRITPKQCNETLQQLEKYALVKLYCNEALQNDPKTYFLPDFLTSQEPEPVEKRVSEHRQRSKPDKKQAEPAKNPQKSAKCNDSLHRHEDMIMHDDDVNNKTEFKRLIAVLGLDYPGAKKLIPNIELVRVWVEAKSAGLIPENWGPGLIIKQIADGEEPPAAPEPEPEPTITYRRTEPDLLWYDSLSLLKSQMTKSMFNECFSLSVLRQNGSDTSYVLSVKTVKAKDWIDNRLNAMVDRALENCSGKKCTFVTEIRMAEEGF
jgi:hypothetical protein